MRRGEVWWADLARPAGRRRVILLSRNAAYEVRQLVTIAPLTSRIRDIASEVRLGPQDGLPRECVANLDLITTVPKRVLERRIATLRSFQLEAVTTAIHYALALMK